MANALLLKENATDTKWNTLLNINNLHHGGAVSFKTLQITLAYRQSIFNAGTMRTNSCLKSDFPSCGFAENEVFILE
jgi:hypothetical protein